MRTGLLLTLLVGWTLLGATCLPLVGGPPDLSGDSTTLGVTIQSPSADATVPQEGVLEIRWTAYNTTSHAGTARLYVESRADLTQTVLADGVTVSGGSVVTTTTWELAGFEGGVYVIYAEISTPAESASTSGSARVTINARPTFEFTQPDADASFTQGDGPLTIAWSGADREGSGTATIGLDPDVDHGSGDEVFIYEATLSQTDADGSLDWAGNSVLDEPLETGSYLLFALVGDELNAEFEVDAGIRISIGAPPEEEEPNEPLGLSITRPDEDKEFPTSQNFLRIDFTINKSSENTFIDLKIDTDDNHKNGNEGTILADHVVEADTEEGTWNWRGKFADGTTPVPPGIYRLLIAANTGGDAPETAQGSGLVFRRSDPNQPLVALLQPARNQTVEAGDSVTIRWRDDDPSGAAKIVLKLDDDPNPAEVAETDDPEKEIPMPPRAAEDDDGGADIYYYSVPPLADLGPGIYYVFAYVDPAEEGGDPHSSVAAGLVIVEDPARQ